ncbi:MAG: peptidoglycan DD-metalloendopeptidase family protein [bacterium]|nr:peptidoglycan DD-metalloendopeptidase family protein [bacterium]
MLKEKLTFMVVPDSQGVSKQLSIPVWSLYASVLAILLLLFLSVFFASEFFAQQVEQSELEGLKAENQQLAAKYEELRWALAETSDRYDELVQKEIAIRAVFDLPEISLEERQLGIGGPGAEIVTKFTETEQLAYTTEADVDRLLRLSRFELEKYDEAEKELASLKDRLDHTPSIWPAKGWFSRGYGMKDDPFTGYKQLHRGIDVANYNGTPIIAAADGKVTKTGSFGRMGKMITIDHGFGFVTRYGHLSSIDVKRGQRIKRGDVVGKMGSTGYSTGPHLHYEVWRNGKVLNPMNYILNSK